MSAETALQGARFRAERAEAEVERLREALLALYGAHPAEVTDVLNLRLDGRRLLAQIKPASDEGQR